jgi:hypothetical protein
MKNKEAENVLPEASRPTERVCASLGSDTRNHLPAVPPVDSENFVGC